MSNDLPMLNVLAVLCVLCTLCIIWLLAQLSKLKNTIHYQHQQMILLEDELDNLADHMALEFAEEKRQAVEDAKKRSRTSQRNQIKGQMGERFTPFMQGFEYNPSDCRFLGEPIDYVIFNNLHECSEGRVPLEAVELIIVDVKTGNARLSLRQKIMREVINNGQVRFETLRIVENEYGGVEVMPEEDESVRE